MYKIQWIKMHGETVKRVYVVSWVMGTAADGDFLGLCKQKLSIHHGSYSQRLLCHGYFSRFRKRTPVKRACTSWSVIIRIATLNSWRATQTNSKLIPPRISLFHRAFFNSIMDKTPTHALFTQHYISLACWFHYNT